MIRVFLRGLWKENPIFFQVLGMCPTLAVTTSLMNGLGMGLATTAVLVLSNLVISLIRSIVPKEIRIPIFIVVIATFVTMIKFLLQAYVPSLYASLGLFIPLIVVNCLILARAESFASSHGPISSLVDGLGMGLGFTLALGILGLVREFFATGGLVFMGNTLFMTHLPKTISMILPPGAFLTLGLIMALINGLQKRKDA